MTEAGIEPAISGLFLTKIALNPKGGCFKIRILFVFFIPEHLSTSFDLFLQFLYS